MSNLMNVDDTEDWQVYVPRWKRKTLKKASATPKQDPKVVKTEKELVADLINDINEGLNVKDLTTQEVYLLEKNLGNEWFEILGVTKNPRK